MTDYLLTQAFRATLCSAAVAYGLWLLQLGIQALLTTN